MKSNNFTLAIVSPCYNEDKLVKKNVEHLKNKIIELKKKKLISKESFVCIVDDGSTDNTQKMLAELQKKNKNVLKILTMKQNVGQFNAIRQGLKFSKQFADVFITIDFDLEDDTNVIDLMVQKYRENNTDIIFGCRHVPSDRVFVKTIFYKIIHLIDNSFVLYSAYFLLLSKNAVSLILNNYNINIKTVIHHNDLKKEKVYYQLTKRTVGETKMTTLKLLKLSFLLILESIKYRNYKFDK